MKDKKFLGKIRQDPWESLAKGPKEVMASLWQEYLQEVLNASRQSGRFRIIRRNIEDKAGFQEIYRDWNTMAPEARAEAWKRLIAAAKEELLAHWKSCVRCGECCELSSPTLLAPDLALFRREILTWNEVYALRPGEQVTSREGKASTLAEERLKVREVPGSRQCWFYLAATNKCRIYEDRPEQCRRQQCWGEEAPVPEAAELLSREALLADVPEIWDLITAHEERCALSRVFQTLQALETEPDTAGEALFDALHFDHYLRQMLQEEWELSAPATEFILGRPLTQFLRDHGINAALTPEGTFRLTPRCE
ncbi:MAG: YkgJ family cysteine cluster protein [Deltaproteobacteria bacterium]|nr:YkgJ family cysteine cluster protein [Deltaproteobacteria bacterium]MBI4794957.1 YkgJ family cysteine cluster protein [Deltaproteobacteria bacterium]